MEIYRVRKKNLCMVFIDLEKAYDSVSRKVIWWTLEKTGNSFKCINAIKDMSEGATMYENNIK